MSAALDEASPRKPASGEERERPKSRRDLTIIVASALLARLAVVAWAAGRFGPTGDGTYYDKIARRIAAGDGYTWLWPDGAVTFAAHYPIGYPGLLGALYAIFGANVVVAMTFNAVVGAVGAGAAHALARRFGSPRTALIAGLLVAFHPGLVFYTPALMTEAVTGSLLAVAAAVAAWARPRAGVGVGAVAIGLVVGVATLVRPQAILCAPIFAALAFAPSTTKRAVVAALVAGATALAVCAPWTARNCVRMNRCALVSVNGGWNLLIGTDGRTGGGWAPVEVPLACREVWDEAAKDACFERAARAKIAADPAGWLGLAPGKLATTFDYSGAPGWYLHASNPDAFGDRAKLALGVVETAYERIALLLGLIWAGRDDGSPRRRARLVVASLGAIAGLTRHGFLGYVALVVAGLLRGRSLARGPVLASAAVALLGLTLLTHAVFFGSGRYALVAFPLTTALAALGTVRRGEATKVKETSLGF